MSGNRSYRRLAWALISAALSAPAASGQSAIDPLVGTLELGSGERCVATLIEPDVVITAAHCLVIGAGTNMRLPSQVRFSRTYDGVAVPASVFILHPHYVPAASPTHRTIATDVALVRLTRAVSAGQMLPVEVGSSLRAGESVVLVRSNRADQSCIVEDAGATVAVLSCLVGNGDSGAPLFRIRNGRPVLAGIVSARNGNGVTGAAIAVEIAIDLPEMRSRLPGAR